MYYEHILKLPKKKKRSNVGNIDPFNTLTYIIEKKFPNNLISLYSNK